MLWFVAIPLLDCIGLIFKRIRKGKSLSTAGRDHIHHKLMEKFSSKGTLSIILLITFATGLIGIVVEIYVASFISTYIFFVYAFAYYLLTNYSWSNFIRDN